MKKVAAFFDIDGTLYREGLITEVFKKMIKYEIIHPKRWYNEVRPEYLKWDNRIGDYDDYLLKMANIYIEAIKGLHKYQVEFIAKNVVEQKGDRVYTYTRNRIRWHKKQGHLIVTVSGSPIELVKEMSLKHGFDDFKGSIYELNDNEIYTGKFKPMWDSRNKKKAIAELIEKYDVDINKSYAYGDTTGDLSMFQMMRYPVCVNPTKELLNKILKDEEVREKISIIVERKDVIYNLKPDNIDILDV